MEVIDCPHRALQCVQGWKNLGASVGLIPTMGALHDGHLSLANYSMQECERTVATIFVNPTQFGPNEDYSRYPRNLDQDIERLATSGVDMVFAPEREALYPRGYSTFVDPPNVANPLEGVFRPGHFRGVTTIVLKLFQILPASIAYFGLKDFQQLAVIRQMVHDLNIPVKIQGCPTIREADGLALSSRNRYLSDTDRKMAVGLWEALRATKRLFDTGERQVSMLESEMLKVLNQNGVQQVDYARVVDATTLGDLQVVKADSVALIAARIGPTRLIDNMLLEVHV